MKGKIKQRIDKVRAFRYRASYFRRMRYWRGHGIHSPFVYNMIRKVFMENALISEHSNIAMTLLDKNIASARTATQIQNLCCYCGYESAAIFDKVSGTDVELLIFDKNAEPEAIAEALTANKQEHKAAVILAPHANKARHKICSHLSKEHQGISIDKFNMLLLLFDDKYLKHHYKI